ncbi:hypothetical protein H6F76_01740 [Leptolyngbya sp. FACHB-321]|uniref:hypothetical protein n=1 Tax=Leptolyngbya sp. FACHB-321 TaxID=2692807 RepID=UPI001685403B|nr:hypothetical protein [Leptolyngbya sp. FACHB-321]MBD2033786.1 hypothetical protein [Leptolyngbya sp. FACHB-321]
MTDKLDTALNVHQLLAVSEHKRSGLIICKAHHAEFAGPGAAVGTLVEQACVSVIAIGAPEIVSVVTHQQRQTAYSRRIQWMRWLQKITDQPDAIERAEKLFASFEEFFGAQALNGLPDEVLALLIGVLPMTIAAVRSQRPTTDAINATDLPPAYASVNFNSLLMNFNPRSSRTVANQHGSSTNCTKVFKALYHSPSGIKSSSTFL